MIKLPNQYTDAEWYALGHSEQLASYQLASAALEWAIQRLDPDDPHVSAKVGALESSVNGAAAAIARLKT